jgi:glycolate oxidase iron-sulfur subunit
VRHAIDVERYGPQGASMTSAIEACVHCGFCLPTCPTYTTLSEEMDSPRGRIFLVKEVLEGHLELESALPFIDNCLGCQACQTACPSAVDYGSLITSFRGYAEQHRRRPPIARARRRALLATMPHPRRFRLAARLGQLARPLVSLLPHSTRPMLELLPGRLPRARPLPDVHPAEGERRARVALLAGCAQQVLEPDIAWATLRVLARNGVETVIPPAQGCCGALAMHTGATNDAQRFARRNLDAFADDVDAVVTTAAGCGSGMREYGLLFEGDPEHAAAVALANRVVDVTVFLDGLGLRGTPPELATETAIAYQDACHLAHAQGVRQPPRRLIEQIGNARLVEAQEWELCCGSAGTYNIEKPETAAKLGERKARNLIATAPDVIATGNIGCMAQIRTHLRTLGHAISVLHTMQLLDRAYLG